MSLNKIFLLMIMVMIMMIMMAMIMVTMEMMMFRFIFPEIIISTMKNLYRGWFDLSKYLTLSLTKLKLDISHSLF